MDYIECEICNAMKCHMLCFPKDVSTPELGYCPHCAALLVWGDLVQASKLREKFVQDGISYSSLEDEDDSCLDESDSSVINLT